MSMITVIVGLGAISLLLVAIHVLERSAPEGYEDERGFHYGREPVRVPGRRRR